MTQRKVQRMAHRHFLPPSTENKIERNGNMKLYVLKKKKWQRVQIIYQFDCLIDWLTDQFKTRSKPHLS